MKAIRTLGILVAVVALGTALFLYGSRAARSSDHQDTFNLATRSNTSADITDVYVFPSPANSANVVLVMDVSPLIPAGMGPSKFFDPSVLWQFKMVHGAVGTTGSEDEVIQMTASGTDASQRITFYGPGKPNEVGTKNTLLKAIGSTVYNTTAGTTFSNGMKVFAGPRADPFYFDLFAFFSFLGDRNWATHSSQSDPGKGDTLFNGNNAGAAKLYAPGYDKHKSRAEAPSFNGFAKGTMSSATDGYACATFPATNTLAGIGGGFNVLSFVVELPRSLLTTGYSSPIIHVWATASSVSGS